MIAPDHFYKYRSLNGEAALFVERTICHDEIFLAAPKSFNDPFDCRPPFDMTCSHEEVEQLLARVQARRSPGDPMPNVPQGAMPIPGAADFMREQHETMIRDRIGVYCVSAVNDDLLMWAHYANAHKGICLEFDSSLLPLAVAQEVNYSSVRDAVNPFRDTPLDQIDKAILRKSDHWRYEKEWRIVEHDHGPGVYAIPGKALTAVILGAEISAPDAEMVTQWLSSRREPVRIYQARANATLFKVDVVRVR